MADTIAGDLSVIDLPTLLQTLAQQGRTGMLTIGAGAKVLAIDGGDLEIVQRGASGPGARPLLGQILLMHGLVRRESLVPALERQKGARPRRRLGDILLERGAILRPDLQHGLDLQVEAELCALLARKTGRFEFRPALVPAGGRRRSIPALVMEAARRQDELQRARACIPSPRWIPVRVRPDPHSGEISDRVTMEVLDAIDGRRSVKRIVDETLYPENAVDVALCGLVERGRVVLREKPVEAAAAGPAMTVLVVGRELDFATAVALELARAGFTAASLSLDHPTLPQSIAKLRPQWVLLDPEDLARDLAGLRQGVARVAVLVSEPTRQKVIAAMSQGAATVVRRDRAALDLLDRIKPAA